MATAVTGGATATQAAGDSGGTTTTVAVGEYIYTFKTKAPAGFNPTLTNRIGIYGSRNLTEWDLGTADASTTFDFVPAGGTPARATWSGKRTATPATARFRSMADRAWAWPLHHVPPAADQRPQHGRVAGHEGLHS